MQKNIDNNKVINMSELFNNSDDLEIVHKIDIQTNEVNLLNEPELLGVILTEIKLRSLILEEINIYAFCILPFHISMVISMRDDEGPINKWVKKFKAYITRNSENKKLWKPKFKLENIDNCMLTYKCSEVVEQPQHMGLVDDWYEYGFSFKI
ncbi:MAG: hypothetical protein ACQESP_10990 [Candidatus Muiribacteriota bacterium]